MNTDKIKRNESIRLKEVKRLKMRTRKLEIK